MKIFYFTTTDPKMQGDIQENVILIGLRELLGDNVIDYPRKKVLYGEFDESPIHELHGRGFTLCTTPLKDVGNRFDPNQITEKDVIIYGVCDAYGITDYPEFNKLTPNIFYVDGHDDARIRKKPCFKREYHVEEEGVFGTGFGVPDHKILPLSFNKKQLYQSTFPLFCLSEDKSLQYFHNAGKYLFEKEEDYYEDMRNSWFGLTCQRGGWDCLRHYEIMAAGSVLIFKNYASKPHICAPVGLPCISYNNVQELFEVMQALVPNNKPTKLYREILFEQRSWLLKFGTCKARALRILQEINLRINT